MIRVFLVLLALSTPVAAEPPADPKLMPFHEVVKILADRFTGRLLAARLDAPTPFEFTLGANAVHEITLLSPQRNIILIRMDAVTGKVLDIRGRGLTEARKPDKPSRPGKAEKD